MARDHGRAAARPMAPGLRTCPTCREVRGTTPDGMVSACSCSGLAAPGARPVIVRPGTRSGAKGPGSAVVPPFDGYPYLVTRIGRSALHHLAVLPSGWARDRLVALARAQALANRLETCLCRGPADAVYVSREGEAREAALVPSGIPVTDRLAVAGPVPDSTEQEGRRAALRAYVGRWTTRGYLVGDGLPQGLRRCPTCRSPVWTNRNAIARLCATPGGSCAPPDRP